MCLIFVTETISRTDEGQPRPKYISNKCGTNIYILLYKGLLHHHHRILNLRWTDFRLLTLYSFLRATFFNLDLHKPLLRSCSPPPKKKRGPICNAKIQEKLNKHLRHNSQDNFIKLMNIKMYLKLSATQLVKVTFYRLYLLNMRVMERSIHLYKISPSMIHQFSIHIFNLVQWCFREYVRFIKL